METNNYTSKQSEEKIKGYKRKTLASIITMSAGGVVLLLSVLRLSSPLEAPKEYNNAKETITKLEIMYNLAKNQTFPYKDGEIQFILNKDTLQISKLEKAMQIVKDDISKMEKSPEYIEYNNKDKGRDNKYAASFIAGLVAYALGTMGKIIFSDKIKGLKLKQMLQVKK